MSFVTMMRAFTIGVVVAALGGTKPLSFPIILLIAAVTTGIINLPDYIERG